MSSLPNSPIRKGPIIRAALILSAVLVFLLVAAFHMRMEESPSGVLRVLSEEEYREILSAQSEAEYAGMPGDLRIGSVPVPFESETHLYYVPQLADPAEPYTELRFFSLRYRAYFCPDPFLSDRASGMAQSHVYPVLFTDGRRYYRAGVVFTGLPVLSVKTDPALFGTKDGDTAARFTLYEPTSGSADISSFCASFRLRGRTSLYYPKKSYRFTVRNSAGKRIKTGCLGLGVTDEWNLLSLYMDSTRLRDKVCTDLWNDLCAFSDSGCIPTDRMTLVELLIDGDYEGLYALALPMPDPGNLERIPSCRALFKGVYLPSRGTNIWDWKEECADPAGLADLKSPEGLTEAGVSERYRELEEFLEAFAPVRGNSVSYEELARRIDPACEADFCLYLQLVTATDNYFNNLYHLERQDGKWVHIPFDLTTSFGFPHDAEEEMLRGDVLLGQVEEPWMYFEGERLLAADGSRFSELLSSRWRYLSRLFSAESLKERFQEGMRQLSGSGVLIREGNRWDELPVSTDLDGVFRFIDLRTAYLDGLYGK